MIRHVEVGCHQGVGDLKGSDHAENSWLEVTKNKRCTSIILSYVAFQPNGIIQQKSAFAFQLFMPN
jgi:hypothetical protein